MLEVITGSMFSGKTGALLNRLLRSSIAGKTVLVFKPELDQRYSNTEVVSHDDFRVAAVPITDGPDLLRFWEERGRPEVVGVDEVQFLPPSVVCTLEHLSHHGVRVIVAGLSMDFLNRPFPVVAELLARADRVDMMVAVCHTCREESATRSQLLHNGVAVTRAGTSVRVGGLELYEARCRDCFEHEGKTYDEPEQRRALRG